MAHFALVNARGIVEQVIVAEQDVIDSGLFGNPSSWIQTSYNTYGGVHQLGGTPLRKNFASIGSTYNSELDAFIAPKPFASWILNTITGLWEAPVPQPDTDHVWVWDEPSLSWIESSPIVPVEPATTASDTISVGTASDTISVGTASDTISVAGTSGSDTITTLG